MVSQLSTMTGEALDRLHAKANADYAAFKERGLKLNLTRGKPSAAQLDLSNELLSLPGGSDYLSGAIDCRNYGDMAGLPDLRALLAPVFGLTADRVLLGNNASLSLMHDAVVFALLRGTSDSPRPWSKESRVAFLCPVPGYDRHFAICQDFGIQMISVPLTDQGPDMDVVEALVAEDAGIKGMWCVPKYSNPTGTVYSDETVDRLARMRTAAPDFRLFWDNAYAVHHLTADRVEISNIDMLCTQHGHANRPFIFGSTSKITFAGAGVGIFGGSAANVAWYAKHMSTQTIGGDKVNQLRHLRLLKTTTGVYDLMERHRSILAPKFDTVLQVFADRLGALGVATWTKPQGGYFITLDVPDGCAKATVRLAKEAGLELTPAGATHPYGSDPNDRTIRIAPSFPPLSEVAHAAEGVACSVLLAATEACARV